MEEYSFRNFDYHLLKTMTNDDLVELAKNVREEIIKDVSHNGGHLSSNLGVVELTISLLKIFDPKVDDILFDVGHQTYTFKILTGRDLSLLRLKNGPSGFSNKEESPYDKINGGHSSNTISLGLGMATAKKLAHDTTSKTIVVIGDSSMASGMAFEALNNLDDAMYGKLLIILNDNNMSISKPRGKLSRFLNRVRTSVFYQNSAGRFKRIFNRRGLFWIYKSGVFVKNIIKRIFTNPNLFDCLNCCYLGPIDGHNFNKLEKFIKRADSLDESVILHVKTKKGKGYKSAEEDEEGYWHGVSPFEPNSGHIYSNDNNVSYSQIAGNAIYDKLKNDPKACLICPAMIIGGHLEKCFKDFPERTFDTGIAEEHAVDLAGGFALKGYHPIISIYSTFMQRSYDQLLIDIDRMKLPVLILVERAGLVGSDGSSHQGIFDMQMTIGMPNSEVYMPYNGNQLRKLINVYNFDSQGPRFIRIEKDHLDLQVYLEKKQNSSKDVLEYGLSEKEDSKDCLVVIGSEGNEVFHLLEGKCNLIRLNKIKPFPQEALNLLLKMERVSLYNPCSTSIGLGSYLAYLLLQNDFKGTFKDYSIPSVYVEHASKKEQLEEFKLDTKTFIANFTKNLK